MLHFCFYLREQTCIGITDTDMQYILRDSLFSFSMHDLIPALNLAKAKFITSCSYIISKKCTLGLLVIE